MTRLSLTGTRSRSAFTLVELLVVIGIIALLISILLPSLQSARRSANSIKCQANLRSIGQAFFLYGNAHDGVWPVAVHSEGNNPGQLPPIPGKPAGSAEQRWYTLLAPYVVGRDIENANQMTEVGVNTALRGCPEWVGSNNLRATGNADSDAFADAARVGYGMQYYPTYFEDKKTDNLAYIQDSGRGRYVKQTTWQRNGSERGIVADGFYHIIQVPSALTLSERRPHMAKFQPYDFVTSWDPSFFYIDAARHLKPGSPKTDTWKKRGINLLFCDGHVESVTVEEAYNSFRSPGEKTAQLVP